MYTIKFYNSDDVLICVHTIVSDCAPLEIEAVNKYCKLVASTYDVISLWRIYTYDAKLAMNVVL